MTKGEFLTAVDKLYMAVRDSVGYNDNADKLIDFRRNGGRLGA